MEGALIQKKTEGGHPDIKRHHIKAPCINVHIQKALIHCNKRVLQRSVAAEVARELWKRCEAKGDIYLGRYEGWSLAYSEIYPVMERERVRSSVFSSAQAVARTSLSLEGPTEGCPVKQYSVVDWKGFKRGLKALLGVIMLFFQVRRHPSLD